MLTLTRKMIDNELVPLLNAINEQVSVEDATKEEVYYLSGVSHGPLCKFVPIRYSTIYLWANGDVYCSMGITGNPVISTIKKWLVPKFAEAHKNLNESVADS